MVGNGLPSVLLFFFVLFFSIRDFFFSFYCFAAGSHVFHVSSNLFGVNTHNGSHRVPVIVD